MAKKQTFGDKLKRQGKDTKRMAQLVTAEKKGNGHYRFKSKMVNAESVRAEIKAARG